MLWLYEHYPNIAKAAAVPA